ncbi:hypothetical protein SAMN05660330_02934 [Desulforhopalus singaporensis]|uniref:Outer-membrane lipoprotein LolB n=2 Tax=Desulforhopalus singaporensis TaxID=91360 RepID=A0A1H0T538_9BACT|nr:hypothetical protein SAMN05660330_02934 [Desulforhopalus singaporensis]
MSRLVTCIMVVVLLSGCGRPGLYTVSGSDRQARQAGLLANIIIEQWGRHRFSGLLAVQDKYDGLSFALLDATGVVLLQGAVVSDPEEGAGGLRGVMKKSRVGDFLTVMLRRIFLEEPVRRPCSRDMLSTFCAEVGREGNIVKYLKAGPFTLWEIKKIKTKAGNTIVYGQPWLGVRVAIKEIEGGTK